MIPNTFNFIFVINLLQGLLSWTSLLPPPLYLEFSSLLLFRAVMSLKAYLQTSTAGDYFPAPSSLHILSNLLTRMWTVFHPLIFVEASWVGNPRHMPVWSKVVTDFTAVQSFVLTVRIMPLLGMSWKAQIITVMNYWNVLIFSVFWTYLDSVLWKLSDPDNIDKVG